LRGDALFCEGQEMVLEMEMEMWQWMVVLWLECRGDVAVKWRKWQGGYVGECRRTCLLKGEWS